MSMMAPELLFLLTGAVATSPPLAAAVDVFVPVYTAIALCIVYGVYKEEKRVGEAIVEVGAVSRGSLKGNGKARKAGSGNAVSTTSTSSSGSTSASSAPGGSSPSSPDDEICRTAGVDMTGVYKLDRNENYQKFLEVQGVGWALRKAADSASTVHHITHDRDADTFHLKVVGLVSSEMGYTLNSAPVETQIKDKKFMDTITYLKNGQGIRITKVNAKDQYRIVVERELSKDGNSLQMRQTVSFDKPGKPSVTAIQYFKRQG